jgi:hypothetical protein
MRDAAVQVMAVTFIPVVVLLGLAAVVSLR